MDIPLIRRTEAQVRARRARIAAAALAQSPFLHKENFERIAEADLAMLFELYDAEFFDGRVAAELRRRRAPLTFRLSGRMTKSAGNTAWYRPRGKARGAGRVRISIAHRLFFQSFTDDREVRVNGLPCASRLEALLGVFEHELLHLVEMLTFGTSSCKGSRFKQLASDIFGHADTRHALVTVGEYVAERHGVRPGDEVCFEFRGRRLTGRVNRVNRRATVLVTNPKGSRYTDGGTYDKYYVPLERLAKVSDG